MSSEAGKNDDCPMGPGDAKKAKTCNENGDDISKMATEDCGKEPLEEIMGEEDSYSEGAAKSKNSKKARSGRPTNPHEYYLNIIGKKDQRTFSFKSAVVSPQMAGHTGYLTFGSLYAAGT